MSYIPPDFAALTTPRPAHEYHDDLGDVIWWAIEDDGFPAEPPYYIGSQMDPDWPFDEIPDEGDLIDAWGRHLMWTPLPNVNQISKV